MSKHLWINQAMNPDHRSIKYETHSNTERRSLRILFMTLILCLCAGSLAILAILNSFVSIPGISGMDLENQPLVDQIEFEEDFLIDTLMNTIITDLLSFSKSKPVKLNFQPACLSPVAPPPKFS